jgi:hypothetical protein
MPNTPLPDELKAFLAEPNPSVIATVTEEGEPHSAATCGTSWRTGASS